MSETNSIKPTGEENGQAQETRGAFDIPEGLANRYQVRVIEGPTEGERRIGMFINGDNASPALEIANERIMARREDRETIASLVQIARHNGWEKIDVEGSPEFRKGVWEVASREGLSVSGYEPSFVERERMEILRREEAERRERDAARQHGDETAARVADVVAEVASTAKREAATTEPNAILRDGRNVTGPEVEPVPSVEDRATLERAFERSIRALEQTGDPRAVMMRETASALVEEIYGERDNPTAAGSLPPQSRPHASEGNRPASQEDLARRDHEALADLFLNGSAETIAADPRLARAREAQEVMELHIAEVFPGDPTGQAAANLESRQMISDVLRRGLDVSVREPTPVRQIEPVQPPELER
ncbi:hypothetical protein J2X73_004661 [Novosphingobium sp. 1748]|uniref:LPD7 domain-containing protein n=1 Tax=Novosphingobium sp. 1748 TaxID=2817760 RepID=UPI00285DFB6D|nr:LPD7 domain-containing protein [Novosphingobium sp. 1748]MDR6710256.1 hypothetical protein [Novosphingobium sp. 1748]